MTVAAFAVRPGAPEHGVVCPECAGPKHRQSRRCASCYQDARRRGDYPDPPRLFGMANGRWKADGHTGHRATGGPKGRPQTQTHPWRSDNTLLFQTRRIGEMADQGIRPATPGGRIRAHFATVTEDAA